MTDARQRARDIATRALAGEYELFLACIDLDALRDDLEGVPEDVLHVFMGIASEVDDLPIGSQRQYWAPEALVKKDVEADGYREQVREVATQAFRDLLAALEKPDP